MKSFFRNVLAILRGIYMFVLQNSLKQFVHWFLGSLLVHRSLNGNFLSTYLTLFKPVLEHFFARLCDVREVWLAVVILRSSFAKTDVHLPRCIHTGEFTTCFICPLDIYSDDAHSTLSHHHVYMCSDYQWSILFCTYYLFICFMSILFHVK